MKTDDSQYILEALHECNNGGTVVFPEHWTYVIGTALNMTFLKHVDIGATSWNLLTEDLLLTDAMQTSKLTFNSPMTLTTGMKVLVIIPCIRSVLMPLVNDFRQANAFHFYYQNATTFFVLGGEDVNVYGGGMLDGNGQIWYDLYAQNDLILRPILFCVDGLNLGSISDIYYRYSPQWNNFLANSTDVVYQGINIGGHSHSNNTAKNTDGWDIYRSTNCVVQNSIINNGDDCVSFKPNATEILVQNLFCNGSHGISVGSLGQYVGEIDIVENVYVSFRHNTCCAGMSNTLHRFITFP